MEGIEMEDPEFHQSAEDSDVCARILLQFDDAANEHHLHVCAAIGAMSQELKEQNLPLKPLSYFGATCSSLQRLSSAAETETPGHLVDALVTILSEVIELLQKAVLRKKFDYLADLLMKVLRLKSVGPDGVISGLKCVSHLAVENLSWAEVSPLFGVLVGYLTDDGTNIRKQAHSHLRHVLESYEMSPMHTPLLAPASEAVTKVFERSLLLAGGTNSNVSEGPKGAQEVLYILDALRICLPYMTSKSSTKILKYFKSLLELRQPLVTRRITDCVNAFCLVPSKDVSPEAILDLLCSLAASVSNESSADSLTFTARLLDVGIKRVYMLNRQICVVKLPIFFNALSDILASEHEEALLAAVQTCKSLINGCIDENLVKQGVDQITLNANVETRKSMPTIIEKVCATVGSLLDYNFSAVWDKSFQVLSALFDKLGQSSSYFLKGALQSLADMQKLPDEDFRFRKELHECVGSALCAMGPETFLSILPLNLNSEDLSEANLWLFPILKQYTVGAQLSFFTKSLLGMIKDMKQKSTLLEQNGRIISARNFDGIVYSLWSLLPSFCNYPRDTAKSFKDLGKAICSAIQTEDHVRGIICSSLQILVQQNKKILEGKENLSLSDPSISDEHDLSISEKQAISYYSPQIAADNLSALRSSAHELLSALMGVFFKSSKDSVGPIQVAIAELASVAEKKAVTGLFKSTMHKLLKVTQEVGEAANSGGLNSMQLDSLAGERSLSSARAQLLDLSVSLLPGLDDKEIDILYLALVPGLKDVDGLIQKKAYKVLSLIIRDSEEFVSRKLEELLSLMIEVLPSCHFSAKRHRLDSLYFLIAHLSKNVCEQNLHGRIASFLTEIILAVKEGNKKTRNRAYDILVQVGHIYGDEEKGGQKEDLHKLFNMVAGGLAGETPQMISASVKGLARLAYEFSDLLSMTYALLPSTFLLLQRKNKEVIKAGLGLLKVLVVKSQAENLETHLRDLVEGLLNWQDSSKNHFKAKVKSLVEMLIKRCGMEAVKGVTPEEHLKLLINIRKIKEHKEKKRASGLEETRSHQSKATTSRSFLISIYMSAFSHCLLKMRLGLIYH
ncbi:OLC1v1037959C2 [Oldenlandia corymbosa var. corymbosa]|uniref:OLC1v1037959C2 n=1 Tax=Oldenlandia corymbosa var. corymbosa TaxID=529605 RepID=A0AAV1CZL7_OLDCO|nr:OLC1v1037959C2 [Oldenlandia corymbosa var. corymbosa]